MENTATSDGLEGFVDLGSNIFFHQASTSDAVNARHDNNQAPSLIVLCTWLGGASTRRIRKYTTKYQQLFPHACILLIRTILLDITLRSFQRVRTQLAPARDAIRKVLRKTSPAHGNLDNGILLHIFSHGGSNTAIQLAISMLEDGTPLPLKQIVFDCCPGDETFQKAYDAAVASLPAFQPVQIVGRLLLYPAIGTITGLQHFGVMSSVKNLRVQLNDPALFGSHTRRLYLYSAADRMVNFEDVQSHMEAAREQNYQVESILFERAQHCALIMEDSAKYWAAIESFWRCGNLQSVVISRPSSLTDEYESSSHASLRALAKL